jgi:hypothetical protein
VLLADGYIVLSAYKRAGGLERHDFGIIFLFTLVLSFSNNGWTNLKDLDSRFLEF